MTASTEQREERERFTRSLDRFLDVVAKDWDLCLQDTVSNMLLGLREAVNSGDEWPLSPGGPPPTHYTRLDGKAPDDDQ